MAPSKIRLSWLGAYDVRASFAGFADAEQTAVALASGESFRLGSAGAPGKVSAVDAVIPDGALPASWYAETAPARRPTRPLARDLRCETCVIGGGLESMSRVPMMSDGGAWAIDPQVAYHSYFVPQGISADLIATIYGFTRADCDAYALESQRRAAEAWQAGRFAQSRCAASAADCARLLT